MPQVRCLGIRLALTVHEGQRLLRSTQLQEYTSKHIESLVARCALQAVTMPKTGSEPKTFIFNEMSATEVKQTQAYIVSSVCA